MSHEWFLLGKRTWSDKHIIIYFKPSCYPIATLILPFTNLRTQSLLISIKQDGFWFHCSRKGAGLDLIQSAKYFLSTQVREICDASILDRRMDFSITSRRKQRQSGRPRNRKTFLSQGRTKGLLLSSGTGFFKSLEDVVKDRTSRRKTDFARGILKPVQPVLVNTLSSWESC